MKKRNTVILVALWLAFLVASALVYTESGTSQQRSTALGIALIGGPVFLGIGLALRQRLHRER